MNNESGHMTKSGRKASHMQEQRKSRPETLPDPLRPLLAAIPVAPWDVITHLVEFQKSTQDTTKASNTRCRTRMALKMHSHRH